MEGSEVEVKGLHLWPPSTFSHLCRLSIEGFHETNIFNYGPNFHTRPLLFCALIFKCPASPPSTSASPYMKKEERAFMPFKIGVMAVRTTSVNVFDEILNR